MTKDIVPYVPTIDELWATYDFTRQEQEALHEAELAINRSDDEAYKAQWRAYQQARSGIMGTLDKIKERAAS